MVTRDKPLVVPCPTCGGDSIYAASNAHRPFCSERCRNTDLGAWASESYRVADPAQPSDDNPGFGPVADR
jgi:uncharacterized protein